MHYWHFTDKASLDGIMSEGLKPMLGPNSRLVGERETAVFLCADGSLPYWRILLDKDALVRIDAKELWPAPEIREYSGYSEYLSYARIRPERLEPAPLPEIDPDAMAFLLESYAVMASQLCIDAARFAQDHEEWRKDACEWRLDSILAVKDRLDPSIVDAEKLREYLEDKGGNGEYTFLDEYLDTGRKLYGQLALFPDEDGLLAKRKAVSEWIAHAYASCLGLCTGGFTG